MMSNLKFDFDTAESRLLTATLAYMNSTLYICRVPLPLTIRTAGNFNPATNSKKHLERQ
jgi:hypothetical protein